MSEGDVRPGDPVPQRMRLTVVGSAAAWSRIPGRASSSYLLEVGDRAIVLDMGQGSFAELSGYRDPATVCGVLISHLHPDHCIDLVPLRHYLKFGCVPSRSLRLHAPRDLPGRIDALTGQADFLGDLLGEPVEPGSLEVCGFAVDIAPVLHVGPSFAFRVAPAMSPRGPAVDATAPAPDPTAPAADATAPAPDPTAPAVDPTAPAPDPTAPALVYSGDCGQVEDLLPLMRPGDTLLVEASFAEDAIEPGPNHLNAEAAARAATEGRAGRLILTHLLDGYDPRKSLEIARAAFRGEVLLAEPGLRVEF